MVNHPFNALIKDKSKEVLAITTNRKVSLKNSREILSFIKGKDVKVAKRYLELVIEKKASIPFRRYTEGAPHKTDSKYGARYPVNAAKVILSLLNTLTKNAEFKGLDVDKLYIKYAAVSYGYRYYRPRRNRFRPQRAKSTNIYILGGIR